MKKTPEPSSPVKTVDDDEDDDDETPPPVVAPRPEHTKSVRAIFSHISSSPTSKLLLVLLSYLLLFFQVYTRPSMIDPLPPPVTSPDSEVASKAVDRQRPKKGKMTDEEIMDKLSTSRHDCVREVLHVVSLLKTYVLSLCSHRNYSQHWRSKKEVYSIRKDRPRVGKSHESQ